MRKECVDSSSEHRRSSVSPDAIASTSVSPILQTPHILSYFEKLHSTFFERQISLYKFMSCENPTFFQNQQFQPMTMETHNYMEKGSADLVATLLTENFPIFQNLSKADKQKIFGPFAVRFINLHRCWLTSKYLLDNEKIAFHYQIYYHFDDIEKLFGEEAKREDIRKLISPMHSILLRFSQKIGNLDLSEMERGSLIGLILYQQMEVHEMEVAFASEAQKNLLIALHTHLIQIHGMNSGGLRFAQIVSTLTDLEMISNSWNNMIILGNLAVPRYHEIFLLVSDTLSPK
uniref:NR LBD domain-containing protein n=1 Tax=Panagrolaimus sp. PS1159 TaxID=55785 RepID=A0AC35F068_9BILA